MTREEAIIRRKINVLDDDQFTRKTRNIVNQLVGLTVAQARAVLQEADFLLCSTCGVFPVDIIDTDEQSQAAFCESA